MKWNDFIEAAFGMLGLGLAVMEADDFFSHAGGKERYEPSDYGMTLRYAVSSTTLIVLVLCVHHSYLNYVLQKESGKLIVESGFFKHRIFRSMIFELIILAIHTPPHMNYVFRYREIGKEMRYSVASIISVIMMVRLYLVFRLFTRFTKWRNEHSERCCELSGTDADSVFAMKAMFKERPYIMLLINSIVSSVVFGFAVRTFEGPYYDDEVTGAMSPDDDGYQAYDYAWNGWWLIVVTMTTVGFGDYFPKTHLGRAVVVGACLYGVFLVSSMVVTLTVSSELSVAESNCF